MIAMRLIGLVSLCFGALPATGRASGDETAGSSTVPATVPPLTLEHLEPAPRPSRPELHPSVVLLDAEGSSVSESGGPLSLMKSCGACHDTGYIARNNYHAQAGLDEMHAPGDGPSGRAWDTSPGLFGRWDPLTYRWLSPPGSARLDLGTPDWIRLMGARHVGGGPAERSRTNGELLTRIEARVEPHPDTHVLDPQSGQPRAWDWGESGTMEINCLLCHMKTPNNVERIKEIQAGRFRWASTATLVGPGIAERDDQGIRWNPEKLREDGSVAAASIGIAEPRDANCRACHGRACRCTDPVVFENSLQNWTTETQGTVFSPDRMLASGMNLKGKAGLSTPWDIHAERLLGCSDCHHAMNNPAYIRKDATDGRPRHLAFDARRSRESDYLHRPDHNLAKGHTSQGTSARHLDGSMRSCEDCHHAESIHEFLPFRRTHFRRLTCQTCHLPRVYAPARKVTDWTLLTPDRKPVIAHRGARGPVNDPTTLIDGYQPVLLVHEQTQTGAKLAPHNLMTSWFWVEGEPPHPVRLLELERALFNGDGDYHPDVLAAFDTDKDGSLETPELRLDTRAKTALVAGRLAGVGAVRPRIQAELQPATLSHGIQSAGFAVRGCLSCHGFDSRLTQEIALSDYVPGGVLPGLVGDSGTTLHGGLHQTEAGGLVFRPAIDPEVAYIHGTNQLRWTDYLGVLSVLGTLAGIVLHGALRIFTGRRRRREEAA